MSTKTVTHAIDTASPLHNEPGGSVCQPLLATEGHISGSWETGEGRQGGTEGMMYGCMAAWIAAWMCFRWVGVLDGGLEIAGVCIELV